MRINPILYGVFVLTVFFGIILGFQAAGVWSISGKVDASGAAISPLPGDVNTIKGWMTLAQISTTFNVPLVELLTQFDIPADTPATTAIKDLESETFDTTILRGWLQNRTPANADIQPEPSLAVTVAPLAPVQKPPSDPTEVIQEANSIPVAEAAPLPTEHIAPVGTVTGKTTFQELLEWGVPREAIQKIIGGDLPGTTTVIKDYITGKGLDFPTVKTQLQAELNKTK